MLDGELAPKLTRLGDYWPNPRQLKALREKFTSGTRVRLLKMQDDHAPEPGTLGTVMHVDDAGTVHTKWDDGHMLGAAFGHDKIEVVSK